MAACPGAAESDLASLSASLSLSFPAAPLPSGTSPASSSAVVCLAPDSILAVDLLGSRSEDSEERAGVATGSSVSSMTKAASKTEGSVLAGASDESPERSWLGFLEARARLAGDWFLPLREPDAERRAVEADEEASRWSERALALACSSAIVRSIAPLIPLSRLGGLSAGLALQS